MRHLGGIPADGGRGRAIAGTQVTRRGQATRIDQRYRPRPVAQSIAAIERLDMERHPDIGIDTTRSQLK